MDGLVVGEVRREHVPLAAGFQDVEEGAEDIVEIVCPRSCFLFCRLEQRADDLELLPGDIARIYSSLHSFVLTKPLERRIYLFGDLR